jgi:hypothetical protein
MYLSQDFRRGPAYRVRSAPDLHPSCRRRDPARAGEICSEFSFPVNVWSRFSFPGNEKNHRPVFQPLPPPMKSNPKKHQLLARRRGRVSPSPTTKTSFSRWWQSNRRLLKKKKNTNKVIRQRGTRELRKYFSKKTREKQEGAERVFFFLQTGERGEGVLHLSRGTPSALPPVCSVLLYFSTQTTAF